MTRQVTGQASLITNQQAVRRYASEAWGHSPDGLVLVDIDGTIIGANPAMHKMLGYELGDLDGQSVEVLLPEQSRHTHVGLRFQYAQNPEVRSMGVGRRLSALHCDGSLLAVQVSLAPLSDDPAGVTLAAVRDLSDWVESEQHIAELNLKRMVAEERDRIARDLHDNVIQELFALGLSLQGAVGLRSQDLDERILKAVGSVDSIISSIRRAIFGVTSGEGIASVRARLMAVISDLTMPLSFDPEINIAGPVDDLPVELGNDLLAVVSEALANAVRHSGASSISVAAEVGVEYLTAIVDDNGCGIGDERRSGLKNISERAKRHGGDLEIETGTGCGTTVRWVIPVGLKNR